MFIKTSVFGLVRLTDNHNENENEYEKLIKLIRHK